MLRERREKQTTQRTPSAQGNTMMGACFSASGTRNLIEIEGIVTKEGYVKKKASSSQQTKPDLGNGFVFQYDNNFKFASLLLKNI